MIFNSLDFLIFFGIFFLLYWSVFANNLKAQNLFLLLASYVFYAWWDWRFIFLLMGSSALNFYLGIGIENATSGKHKNRLVFIGLLQGLGLLLLFKYCNFFITSLIDAFSRFDITINIHTLNIILPLGISFYTFKTLSYLLDINKGKIKATHHWVNFFCYVSFFPSLISGPIDSVKTLLPQLEKERNFDFERAKDGMLQILWGLFKKLVIADNCAAFTNNVFNNYNELPGSTLLIGTFLYTIQIYADFSGYSDMAIGFSRLIGFNITKNFDFPFFAQNIAEFWRKWHISLTTWLTEYVFTPLSIYFRDYNKTGLALAIVINFTLIGIWHGANWTFVLFGFLHGCYFIPLIIKGTMNKKKKIDKGKLFPSYSELINITLTFLLVMFTFIIFRSDNIYKAFDFYKHMFSSVLVAPDMVSKSDLCKLLLVFVFLSCEWFGRNNDYAIKNLAISYSKPVRWAFYYLICALIFFFAGLNQQFIYFQF